MVQVNMLEAKTNLSRLVADLENHTNDEVILSRNGNPVARITLIVTTQTGFVGSGEGQSVLPSPDRMKMIDDETMNEFEAAIL